MLITAAENSREFLESFCEEESSSEEEDDDVPDIANEVCSVYFYSFSWFLSWAIVYHFRMTLLSL